jgi:outer membrane immunogenic protein
MKQLSRLTLGFCAAFALTLTALAGPESLPSGKEMKEVAPVAPECAYGWTGFYFGALGGYTFGSIDQHLDLGGTWDSDPANRLPLEAGGSRDLDASGGQLGGFLGYNYQWRRWVFGVEGEGAYLWLRNSSSVPVTGSASYEMDSSFKTHYLATFGPRIGYSFCRWMPYVTGGVAIGDLDYSQRFINQSLFPIGFFAEGGSSHDTNVGWMVGGGLEYQLTQHWRLRAQYRYVDLGSTSFDSLGVGGVLGFPFLGYTGHHSVDLREHTADFGIGFAF